MSTENVYLKGTKVFIPHIELMWECAVILEDYEADQMRLVVQTQHSNKIETIIIKSKTDLPPIFCSEDSLIDEKNNLTSLKILHEASIFHTLQIRFERRCIYNYCGIAMIVLNPFVKLPISESDKILNYRGQTIDRLEPHIFSVAETVYCRLERENYEQSIIFSGESGAGKTENAKYTILYLVTISAKENQVKEKILASSTILQAFGNAKTLNNENSSRFGKYIEIQYDTNYHIIGACVKIFLLDRSRIVFQAQHEQNFNIFYELRSVKDRFPHLQLDEQEFHYLNQGNCSESYNMKNSKYFDELTHALNVLGFSAKHQDEILRILAAILHLGNLNFKKFEFHLEGSNNTESCFISGLCHLQILAKLFNLDVQAIKTMRKWMCYKRIFSQQDEILQPMSLEEAVKARDTLTKFIYTKLFNWIVARINFLFRSPCNVQSFVGILDIYGFEKLNVNSFEQFCINYANEKVQQYFIQSIFKFEQEEYLREEIGWNFIRFQDNRLCVELIEGKYGIIDILEEETKILRDPKLPWIENICLKSENTKYFEKFENNSSDFIIYHFVDFVQYNANEFLEKNRDTVLREQLEILKDTKNDVLNKLVMDEYYKLSLPREKRKTKHKRLSFNIKQNKKTVISEYRNSLITLTSMLQKTTPHYVRCIKTNDDRKPFAFNPSRIAEQLRAYNVLNTIKISATGFFSQQTYAQFFQRYHCLCQFDDIKRDDLQETCRHIINTYIADNSNIKFGKSKVFLRENPIYQLEELRSEKQRRASIGIQKTVRCFMQQKRYRQIRFAVDGLQFHARQFLSRRRARVIREERAAIKIQTCVRGWLQRRLYQRLKRTALALQTYARWNLEHKRNNLLQTEIMASAATEVQKLVRGFLARRERERKLRDIIIIQACVRRFLAKIALDKLKKHRDEHVQLLNRGLKSKIDLLQQKIDCLMEKNLSSRELEEMHTIFDNQQCIQAKNRILNHILFNKIQTLKGLREKQEKTFALPEIEYKKQDLYKETKRVNNRNLYDFFKQLINEEEDCRSYQQLFQAYFNFDQRADRFRQTLGLEIAQLNFFRRAIKENECTVNNYEESNKKNSNNAEEPVESTLENFQETITSEDTITPNEIACEEKCNYEGMLQFNLEEVDALMYNLIIELDPSAIIQYSPDLPSQILFMCIRYLDSVEDYPRAFLLLQNYVRTAKHAVKQRKQLDMIVLWLVNTHRLLNYLKQYSRIYGENRDQFHVENTARQMEQCLRYLDLTSQWGSLYQTAQWVVKKAVKLMKTRTLEFAVPALLDNEEINKLDKDLLNADQKENLPRQKLGKLLNELTSFDATMRKCQLERKTAVQIFKQVFDFLSSIALSNIMSRRELCNSHRGMLIRCNLRNIERWAANHHLLSAIQALSPATQAARFLQIQPMKEDIINWISKRYDKLNYNQIMKLLNCYRPIDDFEIPTSSNVIKKLQFKLAEREDLENTILIDSEDYPVSFPFRHSSNRLEEIEIPDVFNLSMLKKI